MFCSGDDFILKVAAKVDEVIAIACDTDNKVSMIFGIFLGITQGFGVDDVELNMVTIELEVASYQVREVMEVFTCQCVWTEFHIQECAASSDVVELACGFEDGGRAIPVKTLTWGDSFRDGQEGFSAVGRCAGDGAEINMRGCGKQIDVVFAAFCVWSAVERVEVGVEDLLGDGIDVVIIVAVIGSVVN